MLCAEDEDDGDDLASLAQGLSRECRIVLVSGFESFNVELYKKARTRSRHSCPVLHDPPNTPACRGAMLYGQTPEVPILWSRHARCECRQPGG